MALAEITALITGIKGTIDVTKGLKSAYNAHTITQAQTDILEKLFALQVEALALQEKHAALIQEKAELAKKLVQLEDWSQTETQYQLKEVAPRIFVYIAKSPTPFINNEPWYCANCFTQRQKSVLQSTSESSEYHEFTCHRCNKSISFSTGSSSGGQIQYHEF